MGFRMAELLVVNVMRFLGASNLNKLREIILFHLPMFSTILNFKTATRNWLFDGTICYSKHDLILI